MILLSLNFRIQIERLAPNSQALNKEVVSYYALSSPAAKIFEFQLEHRSDMRQDFMHLGRVSGVDRGPVNVNSTH